MGAHARSAFLLILRAIFTNFRQHFLTKHSEKGRESLFFKRFTDAATTFPTRVRKDTEELLKKNRGRGDKKDIKEW